MERVFGRQAYLALAANFRDFATGGQRGVGIGRQYVVAALASLGRSAVEENRPGALRPRSEQRCAVFRIREFAKQRCRHDFKRIANFATATAGATSAALGEAGEPGTELIKSPIST